jgi:transposase-like protein
MTITCPGCSASTIKKNGHIHNGKQNHRCLICGRQFVLNPDQKRIPQEHKKLIRQALLERVSLEGICRIFSVSMPWLLRFIEKIIAELPDGLNATAVSSDELEVAVIELDEKWSYVQNKKNQQWLWLVFSSGDTASIGNACGKTESPICRNFT